MNSSEDFPPYAGGGDVKDGNDRTREELQMIRIKFLRIARRLRQTPHTKVVVSRVLHRLGLLEPTMRGSSSNVACYYNPDACNIDRAHLMAEQLEVAGQDAPLDFSCCILVLGKTGVGKSATINSIFDNDEVKKLATDAFERCTREIQDVVGTVEGIKIRVIDTPGLLPHWSGQSHNKKILTSVKHFMEQARPDVVLYVDRLDLQNSGSGDAQLLRTITDVLGASIWFNKAIVVLTHAASAPCDGPNGSASSYDMFVAQQSHAVRQAICEAASDVRLTIPVALVENNHLACETDRALPLEMWRPHLLLLSFASQILVEASTLSSKLHDIPHRPPSAFLLRTYPLPFILRSLLLPIRPVSMRIKDTANWRGNFDIPNEPGEEPYDESVGNPNEVLGFEDSFNSEDPKYRYRMCSESKFSWRKWDIKPFPLTWAWDGKTCFGGVSAKALLVAAKKLPTPVWFQSHVIKDKQHASLQIVAATTIKHGGKHGRQTTLDFDMFYQSGSLDILFFILRTETRFFNHRHNNACARLLMCVNGDAVSAAGVQVQDMIIVNKQFQMAISGGAMSTPDGTIACGGNLMACCTLSSSFYAGLSLRVMDENENLGFFCAIQSRILLGHHSNLKVYANTKRISIRLRTSKLPEVALVLFIPAAQRFLGYAKEMMFGG